MPDGTPINSLADVKAGRANFINEFKDLKLFEERYEVQGFLAEGGFSTVHKAIFKETGEARAVKVIDKLDLEDEERIRLKYEVDILKHLDHPNIVRLYEIYES